MAAKTIAYLTDAHLGQRIIFEKDTHSQTMRYDNNSKENKDHLTFILEDIAKKGINELVFGGDIGTKEMNQWFFDVVNSFDINLLMVLGNHDTYAEVSKYYRHNHINELYYTLEDDYFKYLYLDSSSNSVSKSQFNWLKQELSSTKKLVIFIHHPILEIKTPLDSIGAALNGRAEIRDVLLELEKEIIIFCGHYHMTDELTVGNIRQYSSPACSYQIEKESDVIEIDSSVFGYRLIRIDGNALSTDVKLFTRNNLTENPVGSAQNN